MEVKGSINTFINFDDLNIVSSFVIYLKKYAIKIYFFIDLSLLYTLNS